MHYINDVNSRKEDDIDVSTKFAQANKKKERVTASSSVFPREQVGGLSYRK